MSKNFVVWAQQHLYYFNFVSIFFLQLGYESTLVTTNDLQCLHLSDWELSLMSLRDEIFNIQVLFCGKKNQKSSFSQKAMLITFIMHCIFVQTYQRALATTCQIF